MRKSHGKLAIVVGVLALSAAPAFASQSDNSSNGTPPQNQGTAHKPSTPGPNASLPSKAKAYGKFCQGESKKHVAGTPGTPFSKCVTDMAKLAKGTTTSPKAACKNESRKHVAGHPGTPFSLCVNGGKQLLHEQQDDQQS
jgi:hypothetical protein